MSEPRALRVLMTADTVGGVWSYAVELARALGPRGVDVTLAAMGGPVSAGQGEEAASVPTLRVVARPYALEWMPDPWRDVDAAARWLLALEREVGADVVHVNGYSHAAAGFAAPVIAIAHSCVCSWWRAVHGGEPPAAWDEYRRRVAAGIRAADAVVAPTDAIGAAIADAHGRAGIRTIYNGRDPSRYRGAAKAPFILAAGRLWDEAKNLAALDAAAPSIPWPVMVAGPTSFGAGGGAAPRAVHVLGSLSPAELARWMSRAAIFAAPARYEPFGLAILEAALSGCALVLGDIASLRELWSGAAVLVAPDDAGALAGAITGLVRDDDRRADLAARARERGRALSADRMADAYRALYDEVGGAP